MAKRPVIDQRGLRDSSAEVQRRDATAGTNPTRQDFAKFDKAIAAGEIAVFSEIKAPPFVSETELIEIKIVLPLKWSSELLERIEACIDEFGEEKGAGKTITADEGTVI